MRKLETAAIAAFALLAGSSVSRQALADDGQVALSKAETEARDIGGTLKTPPRVDRRSPAQRERQLLDAQLAWRVGKQTGQVTNFENAALILYDLVEQNPDGRNLEEATYLLADSLFLKGDSRTSQKYFRDLVSKFGPTGKHYQEALMRLIELSVKLKDDDGIDLVLQALDNVPAAARKPEVPYVRGKYNYFSGQLDNAAAAFDGIGASHPYYFRARYFSGVVRVAQQKYAAAAKAFAEVLRAQPNTEGDRRVAELARLAVGRLFYQTGKPSRAIDEYQKLDRKSPFFDEMLYEVAWAHVKSRAYDKAMRAIDLLTLADPRTGLMPEVRLLRGNLLIRLGAKEPNQYVAAEKEFEKTRAQYEKPRAALEALLAQHDDPNLYFQHLVHRQGESFDVTAFQVPKGVDEAVARKPDVARVIKLVRDIETIRTDLGAAETLIVRVESATSPSARVSIFPELARKRGRLFELRSDVARVREKLGSEERAIIARGATQAEQAELTQLGAQRAVLEASLGQLPSGRDPYEVRVKKARAEVERVAALASRVQVEIEGMRANLTALEKYQGDPRNKSKLPSETFDKEAAELKVEIAALEKQYEGLRAELQSARDQAEAAALGAEEANLRAELGKVLEREHLIAQQVASRSGGADASRISQIEAVLGMVTRAQAAIDASDAKIDAILDSQLSDIKRMLTQERGLLTELQGQLAAYDGEVGSVGAGAVRDGFVQVAQDFYNIVVRADVGVIDVAWAQKEESSQRVSRLNLQVGNERRSLREDFKEVLEDKEKGSGGGTDEDDDGFGGLK